MPAATLVLFGLDRTLVSHDSEKSFVAFLVEAGLLDRAEVTARSQEYTERYNRGEAGAIEFTEFYLGLLSRVPLAELAQHRERWVAEQVRPRISSTIRDIVEHHRAAGDLMIVTTAVFRWLAEVEVAELAIPNLVATEAEVSGGRFTGRVSGIANSREGKVERLHAWLASAGRRLAEFGTICFYSNSANDMALLSHATRPVVLNPDQVLSAHARHAGWEMRWLPQSKDARDGASSEVPLP